MKIKTKLTLNIVMVIAILSGVVITSIFGMTFIRGKLSYLTEKSTPYQILIVEFQRELQSATATLIKVNHAVDVKELQAFRAEAEKSLAGVKKIEQSLEELTSSRLETSDELSSIATELFLVSSEKLQSQRSANEAVQKISARLKESSARLKELDRRIRLLQTGRAKAFSGALEGTTRRTASMRSLEELRNLVKDLQLVYADVRSSQKGNTVFIARGKLNAISSRIAKNHFLASNKEISGDVKSLLELLEEGLKSKTAAISQKTDEAWQKSTDADRTVTERINSLYQLLEQEVTVTGDKLRIEADSQRVSFSETGIANGILVNTSQLISLGLSLEGLSNKLFILQTVAEIDQQLPELLAIFNQTARITQELERSLEKLRVKEEVKIVREARNALDGVRGELFTEKGVIATLKKLIADCNKATRFGEKLREIVLRQAEKGKETVSSARSDQVQAITAVNRVVTRSITLLVVISIAAAIVGVLFGIWVFRSVSQPLARLAKVSENVAGGNLQSNETKHSNDEFGQVQISMGQMVLNLRDMVGRISDSTTTVASSSLQLSGTAEELERKSQAQTGGIAQTVSAITEMVYSIQEVAQNASQTSDAATKMKQAAQNGQ